MALTNICGAENMLKFAANLQWKVEAEEFKEHAERVTNSNGYVLSQRFKEEVLSKVEFKNHDGYIELVLAACLNVGLDKITLSSAEQTITKSSVDNKLKIYIDNNLEFDLSWDVVTVIKLTWWPEVAAAWKERQRCWPSKETVENLTKVGYIITKPSDDEKNNKETLEFRYSFAHIERDLVARRSPHQNLIYLIFKSMIYRWLKPLDSEQIHSFIGKTVMFWTCEQYPPEHQIWIDDDKVTYLTITYLFNELLKAFENGILPYYFIPKINVIETVPEILKKKVVEQIQEMLKDIKRFIPQNVDDIIKEWEEKLRLFESACDVLEKIRNENYDILLSRLDLIPKALEIFGPDFEKNACRTAEREINRINFQI